MSGRSCIPACAPVPAGLTPEPRTAQTRCAGGGVVGPCARPGVPSSAHRPSSAQPGDLRPGGHLRGRRVGDAFGSGCCDVKERLMERLLSAERFRVNAPETGEGVHATVKPLASRRPRPLRLCLWGCRRLYEGPAQCLAHGRSSGGILMTFLGMGTLPWILGEWKCSGKRFLFAETISLRRQITLLR